MAEAGLGRSSWAELGAATFTPEAVTQAPSPRRTKGSAGIDGDRVIAIVTEHSPAPAPADECCVAEALAHSGVAGGRMGSSAGTLRVPRAEEDLVRPRLPSTLRTPAPDVWCEQGRVRRLLRSRVVDLRRPVCDAGVDQGLARVRALA